MATDQDINAKEEKKEEARARREIAETLFDGNNFVKIDDKPIIKTGDGMTIKKFVDDAMTQIRESGGKKLLDDFYEKFGRAAAEYRHRREVYENPITRPRSASDYPLHFIMNVDTKLGWVDEASWEKCKKKTCVENGGRKTGFRKPTDEDLGY